MAIERFRNKATGVIVEAVQFVIPSDFVEIEAFAGGDAQWRGGAVVVATSQGALWVGRKGWAVRDGDLFHSCPPDSFPTALFERVPPVVPGAV